MEHGAGVEDVSTAAETMPTSQEKDTIEPGHSEDLDGVSPSVNEKRMGMKTVHSHSRRHRAILFLPPAIDDQTPAEAADERPEPDESEAQPPVKRKLNLNLGKKTSSVTSCGMRKLNLNLKKPTE